MPDGQSFSKTGAWGDPDREAWPSYVFRAIASVLEAGHLGWAEDILNGEEGQLIRETGDPAWVERLHIFRHRIQELRTLEGEGGVGSLVREDHPMTALLQDTDARLKAFAATKQVTQPPFPRQDAAGKI